MSAFQPASAGDNFQVGPTRIVVTRCSRNPDKPWVDVEVYPQEGASAMWSKRMPKGIPADWQRIGGIK